MLAFGAGTLLYLVVEERLVEAHKTAEAPTPAVMFSLNAGRVPIPTIMAATRRCGRGNS